MKLLGEYPESISRKLYEATPKAVFAGIAAGIVINNGANLYDEGMTPDQYVAAEWVLMHRQGLVNSPPPAWVRGIATGVLCERPENFEPNG